MTSLYARAGRAVLVGTVAGLLQFYGTAFSQDSDKAGPAAPVATPDSRLACPPDAKVEEAVELIRAAYEAAYDKAKDTGEPDPLIEQLTSLANQTTDSAQKYALLLEAEVVATQYENYATALDLLAKRAEQFQIDGLKLKGQLLKRLAGPRVAADLVLFDQASDTAEQAMRAERFDVAAEAAALAVSVAKAIDREQKAEAKKRGRSAGKTGKDESGPTPVGPGLVKKATAFQSRVTAAQKLFADYGEALSQIKAQPDDAAANSVVAKYLCFVRGDWQKGLPAMAKSDLGDLKGVAAEEIALSSAEERDEIKLFALAGKWWSASESKGLTDDQESAIKDHAAGFYAEVVDGLSDVLEKQLAQSRLRGLTARPKKPSTQQIVYLSDLKEVEAKVVHFGFGKGTIQGGKNPIRSIIDGRESPHGLSMHPGDGPDGGCFVKYSLPKGTKRFSATATLDQSGSFKHCGIGFEVIADGKTVWKSETINKDHKSEKCDVAIKDCRNLELRTYTVTAAHGGHAVWIEPYIVVDANGPLADLGTLVAAPSVSASLPVSNPSAGERTTWRTVPRGYPVFQRDASGKWVELNPDGSFYRFKQIAATPEFIELSCDQGRHLRIRLGADSSLLQLEQGGWSRWHAGTWVSEGVEISNAIGMKLKLIPAGSFQMGSDDGEPDEKPVHEVRITRPFYLGVYEVTNVQWKTVMGSVPSNWKNDEWPVGQITWTQAEEFCKQLSILPAEKAAGRVYRLPTEAEWEYACRAGTATHFSFGQDGGRLSDYAWFGGNAGNQTHPVGQKKPNPWGLYDMHGNAWEWCSDWYHSYPVSVVSDPIGPAGSSARVSRGGGWRFDVGSCRSARRDSKDPSYHDDARGLRVALTASNKN